MRRGTPHPHRVTQVIRELLDLTTFVIVVEHDLAVLDYLSDFICCLYGKPGAYGVVTLPFGVRWGGGTLQKGRCELRHQMREKPLGWVCTEIFPVRLLLDVGSAFLCPLSSPA